MKALVLLAAAAMSCTVPTSDHTQGYIVKPGEFAGYNCNHVNLTNTAHFLVISTNAFANSTGFTDVTIPANTRTLEDFSFANSSLQHAHFLSPSTIVSEFAFDSIGCISVKGPGYDLRFDVDADWFRDFTEAVKCDIFS